MKATDLMINDWVEFTSKYGYGKGQVAGIEPREGSVEPSTFTIVKFRDDGTTHLFVGVSRNSVRPIPLTKEILKKNGFEEVYFDEKGKKCSNGDKTDIYECYDGEIRIEVGMYDPMFFNIGYEVHTPEGIDEGNISSIAHINGEPFNIHDLQHVLRLHGIEKEIVL